MALLGAGALAAAHCAGSDYVSPTTEQGPPPFIGPPAAGPPTSASAPPPRAPPPKPGEAPPPLTFFRTRDSREWVARSFHVQSRYARVIAVYSGAEVPAKVKVDKLDFEGPPGPPVELPVTVAVRTLQDAAREARGGDLVAVLPGHYQGFTIGDKPDAADEKFIHFKALGAPGEVIIDRASPTDANWMVIFEAAHHVIFQGFRVAGANKQGNRPSGPNAGIYISGNFVHTSKLAHHLAILDNFSHGHRAWGIHSVDSHTVLVQGNLFADSAIEHSAYFSDGSDDYVIRRNVFSGSPNSGLQINVDPRSSLTKLLRHGAIDYPPLRPSREWALGLLDLATQRFGANRFPDGRGFNFIIEENVINGSGRGGGGAINLAGVRESLIQNNLVYGNLASGIVEWDDNNPFDAAEVTPGPRTVAEVTGPEALPLFGCFNNLIRNNTVLQAVRGRPALLIRNGSWGTRARNNILVNDELPSIEVWNTSIWRLDADYNVLDRVHYEGPAAALKALAIALPDAGRSVLGVTQRSLWPSFVRPGDEPWIVLENGWWKLNPKRPDFHPRLGASMLAGRGDPRELPRTDLEGKPRGRADIGAYAAAGR